MLYVAIVVSVLSILDLIGAFVCAMTDGLAMASIFAINGCMLGCLITGRAFG